MCMIWSGWHHQSAYTTFLMSPILMSHIFFQFPRSLTPIICSLCQHFNIYVHEEARRYISSNPCVMKRVWCNISTYFFIDRQVPIFFKTDLSASRFYKYTLLICRDFLLCALITVVGKYPFYLRVTSMSHGHLPLMQEISLAKLDLWLKRYNDYIFLSLLVHRHILITDFAFRRPMSAVFQKLLYCQFPQSTKRLKAYGAIYF